MRYHICNAVGFLCTILVIPLVSCADAGRASVDSVIERALRESPMMQAIESRAVSKRASGIALKTLQNPTLDAEVRIPQSYRNARGSDEFHVALSQPLRPSDFRARDRVNSLIQSAADSEQSAEVLGFSQQLRLAYLKAWTLEARAQELESFAKRAAVIQSVVKQANAGGLIASGETHLIRAETIRAKYQLAGVSADGIRARSELSKTAGFLVTGVLSKPAFTTLPTTAELLNSQTQISTLARAQLAVKLANAQVALTALDAYPKFAPRLVYERSAEFTNYFGVGLSIDLPFFDRNQGERIARSAEANTAQRVNAYLQSDLFESEVTVLRLGIISATSALNGLSQEILPALRDALLAEEQQLNAGQGSPFRVWQILKEISQTQTETMEKTVSTFANRAELAVLTGVDF